MNAIRNKLSFMQINAGANFAGRLWSASLNLLSIPLVVHALGMEAFGLVSFAALFTTLVAFLDLGLAATINREVARLQSLSQQNAIPTLLRTFESIYWAAAVLVGVILGCASWIFSEYWLHIAAFSTKEIQTALLVAALSLAIRWPTALYIGFLQGCQRQVLSNSIQIATNTFRACGGLIVIYFFVPTVTAYLWFQLAASIMEVLVYFHFARKIAQGISLARGVFSWDIIRSTWRFALSYSAVGVVGMLVSSSDRFILAKFLPISQLGEYSMAATVAGVMPLVGLSIGNALYPVLSAHHAKGSIGLMWKELHKALELTSIAIFGLLLVTILFGNDILRLWTRQEGLAIYGTPVLSLLAFSAFLSAINVLLGTMLTSAGINSAAITSNLMSLGLIMPLNLLLIPVFGMTAAALMSCVQQGGTMLYLAYRINLNIGFERKGMIELARSLLPYVMVTLAGGVGFYLMARGGGHVWTGLGIAGSMALYYTFVLWEQFLKPNKYSS